MDSELCFIGLLLKILTCQFFFISSCLHILVYDCNCIFILGLADNHSPSRDGINVDAHSTSSKSSGHKALYIVLAVAAVVVLCFFLYKIWERKKREEQHARLLRLFEEDDELELELGLRD